MKSTTLADIDDFKSVNDTYGHNCGDYVLKTMAGILEGCSPTIKVCRWGGEEFLLSLNDKWMCRGVNREPHTCHRQAGDKWMCRDVTFWNTFDEKNK